MMPAETAAVLEYLDSEEGARFRARLEADLDFLVRASDLADGVNLTLVRQAARRIAHDRGLQFHAIFAPDRTTVRLRLVPDPTLAVAGRP